MGRVGRLFSFAGRAGRLAYWRVQLVGLAIIVFFWCVGLVLASTLQVGALGAISLSGVLPAMAMVVAVMVRRLHDRGKSAWWLLVFYAIPYACDVAVLWSAAPQAGSALMRLVLSLVGLALTLWGFIELGFIRGENGPNRYGPDPYAAASA